MHLRATAPLAAIFLFACAHPETPASTVSIARPADAHVTPTSRDERVLPPGADDPLFMGVALPASDAGDPVRPSDAPVIALGAGRKVYIDGVAVGDTHQVDEVNRLRRVDDLFTALKERREKWREAHPASSFPGVAVLAFDASEHAVVVKSVFQTAAFAGYPNLYFAVVSHGSIAYLAVDAQVPGPPRRFKGTAF
jgi:hypothetical protein